MPSRPDQATGVVLSAGDVSVTVDPALGGRISQWQVGDLRLLEQHGPHPAEHGMYPMAPWAGRLRGNAVLGDEGAIDLPVSYAGWAMHGTVYTRSLDVVEHVQEEGSAQLRLRTQDHEEWPWPMAVEIDVALTAEALVTTISVIALEVGFPAVVGWHPWFTRRLARGGEIEWSVDATSLAVRGADYLPTGELVPFTLAYGPFDDALHAPAGRAVVRWPGALEVDIANDGDWFVVFDQLPDAVCLEPQSGPPNGVNAPLVGVVPRAEPGRPHRLVTRWGMRALPEA